MQQVLCRSHDHLGQERGVSSGRTTGRRGARSSSTYATRLPLTCGNLRSWPASHTKVHAHDLWLASSFALTPCLLDGVPASRIAFVSFTDLCHGKTASLTSARTGGAAPLPPVSAAAPTAPSPDAGLGEMEAGGGVLSSAAARPADAIPGTCARVNEGSSWSVHTHTARSIHHSPCQATPPFAGPKSCQDYRVSESRIRFSLLVQRQASSSSFGMFV